MLTPLVVRINIDFVLVSFIFRISYRPDKGFTRKGLQLLLGHILIFKSKLFLGPPVLKYAPEFAEKHDIMCCLIIMPVTTRALWVIFTD